MTTSVTVAVLTYNGAEFLDELLTACEQQAGEFERDILVIDSGSTDATLSIIERHPLAKLHQIPNSQFGHGRTRNLAMELADGEVVAFLVQDAVPASGTWLRDLVAPFQLSDRIGCVYGLQVPRPNCRIAVKHDVQSFFRHLGDSTSLRIDAMPDSAGPAREVARTLFFSDVNSAVRRRAWAEVPFRDVPYAEDQALARDMLEAGWLKAYTPFGAVYHSHDLSLPAYYRRMRDEFAGLRGIGVHVDDGLLGLAARTGVLAVRTTRAALRDADYSRSRRLQQAVAAPVFSIARHAAIRATRSR